MSPERQRLPGAATVPKASREPGANHTPDARTCDAIRDLTGGNGADVVFECAGGSVKQGLSGHATLLERSTRSALAASSSASPGSGHRWRFGLKHRFSRRDRCLSIEGGET
jgi:hypothetical protein